MTLFVVFALHHSFQCLKYFFFLLKYIHIFFFLVIIITINKLIKEIKSSSPHSITEDVSEDDAVTIEKKDLYV